MRKEMEDFDAKRELVIRLSREVLKLSKAAIYSLHRSEVAVAFEQLTSAKLVITAIKKSLKIHAHLAEVGPYNEGLEEYVEASCYYWFIEKGTIPTPAQIGVDLDTYLPGLCDLVGELVRKAINAAIKGDAATALAIRTTVTEIYEELLLFDFRNTPLRRKFDSIKYSLEKLEDLALKLSLREGTGSLLKK